MTEDALYIQLVCFKRLGIYLGVGLYVHRVFKLANLRADLFDQFNLADTLFKELAEMIKSLSPATPVLMLTGWGKQMSLSQEEVPQVDMIMAKPPKPAELEMALRKLCRR